MTENDANPPQTPWLSLRLSTGLSQREVERRIGWKRGHLSFIERGLPPTPIRAQELRNFYLTVFVEKANEEGGQA